MALPTLAEVEDVQARLGRDLTDAEITRVKALLRDASGRVRREAGGQIISELESTNRVAVCCGRIDLPQIPVTAVTAVVGVDGTTIDATWDGYTLVTTAGLLCDGTLVDVTNIHGYAEIPDELIGIVCQMVGRALGVPLDGAGVQSETLGAYSYSVGAAAAGGAVGMLDAEREIARSYRKPRRPVSML